MFSDQRLRQNTIDDIVRRAQVAKGTFYLYFHDKEDIMKHLVIQISSQIVIRAYTKTKERNIPDFLPAVLCFIDTTSSISKRISGAETDRAEFLLA